MVILFEGYPYLRSLTEKFLSGLHPLSIVGNSKDAQYKKINGVGYFLDKKGSSHVFVLPKIFVINGKAFGVLDISDSVPIRDSKEFYKALTDAGWHESLLTTVPILLYQSIEKYRKKIRDSYTAEEDVFQNVLTSKGGDNELTLLDISLSLVQFYRENQNLFVMVYKLAHSGFNKVQWGRTVRKATPIIRDSDVIYPFVVNRKKTINYDEELLVIFFNTLRFLNNKYQFKVVVDQPYNLMSDSDFERKLDRGIILRRLRSIRNNYFDEKLVRLWDLLYSFVSKLSSIRKPGAKDDYLFVRDFENVFEVMIDTLLSDSDAPNVLVHQKDKKEVDHLLKGVSITSDTLDIYYIGDSKYYNSGSRPKYSALFKQYTYAKNIIQTEIDWFYSGQHEHLKYRDALTEGYNLTPNFFISGKIEAGYNYTDDHLGMPRDNTGKLLPEAFQKSLQFQNRIFDRDTLFLMQFDVNVLSVISAYVARSQQVRNDFKNRAKDCFKREFISCIEENYDFYLLRIKDGRTLDEALDRHFRALNGKVFCPYPSDHKHYGLLMMGLERNDFYNNMKLILSLQDDFVIKEYHLGTEPYVYYMGLLDGVEASRAIVLRDGIKPVLDSHKLESVIFVDYGSACSPEEAESNEAVPIKLSELLRHCPEENRQRIFTSSFIFLYNPSKPTDPIVGYTLTGTQHYDAVSDELSLGIVPGRFEGELEIAGVIARHTKDSFSGPTFLRFEEVSADSVIPSQ